MSSRGKAISNKYNSCRTFPGLVTKYSEVLSKSYNLTGLLQTKRITKLKYLVVNFILDKKVIIICFWIKDLLMSMKSSVTMNFKKQTLPLRFEDRLIE